MKRRKSTAALKRKLWVVFSEYIRRRDKGVCISCGKKDDWKNMHAGHYWPRTAGLALYFDPRNVNAQCPGCNTFRHGNIAAYTIALVNKYGEGILEELDAERKKIRKISPAEYEALIARYQSLRV